MNATKNIRQPFNLATQTPTSPYLCHHLAQLHGSKGRCQPPRAGDDIHHGLQQPGSVQKHNPLVLSQRAGDVVAGEVGLKWKWATGRGGKGRGKGGEGEGGEEEAMEKG